MHIASVLTQVRGEPVQSEVPAPIAASERPAPAAAAATRKRLPGWILLAVLALLGGLFPVLH